MPKAIQGGIAPGVPGAMGTMIAKTLISRTVIGDAGLAFGAAAFLGALPRTVTAEDTTETIIGVAILDRSASGTPTNPNGYAKGESARIMPIESTTGDFWAIAPVLVIEGDPVYWDKANARWTNTEGTDNIRLGVARWDMEAAAGQPALIRF